MKRSILLLTLLALSLAGCGVDPPEAGSFTGDVGGCGSFRIHRFNTARTSAIVLHVDEDSLALGNGVHEFDISGTTRSITLGIDQFSEPASSYYCDDVGGDPEPVERWMAVSGHLRIEIAGKAPAGTNPDWNDLHTVSVVMTSIVLENGSQRVTIPEVRIENVNVGWLPG